MNICDYIKQNNIPHEVLPDGKIKQVGNLQIISKGITSLDGFVQNGNLDLLGNEITSLKGFVQNGALDLKHNKISSLEGFEQNGYLYLEYNNISDLDGFIINQYSTVNLRGNRIYKFYIRKHTFILYSIIYSKGKFHIFSNPLIYTYTEKLPDIIIPNK
jgi:hypothetical protein